MFICDTDCVLFWIKRLFWPHIKSSGQFGSILLQTLSVSQSLMVYPLAVCEQKTQMLKCLGSVKWSVLIRKEEEWSSRMRTDHFFQRDHCSNLQKETRPKMSAHVQTFLHLCVSVSMVHLLSKKKLTFLSLANGHMKQRLRKSFFQPEHKIVVAAVPGLCLLFFCKSLKTNFMWAAILFKI